ncbi:MAG: aldo/keto reductase [Spirochaetales bacterium]|nr:aldo/keto reductase [Spirochaetales bacterium]
MKTDFTLSNGNLVPAIGLGTFRIEDQSVAANTVRAAIEAGYRHIDTAAIYGNEEGVGRGLIDSGINRKDIFLTTKIWNDELRNGRIREAFAESLERLKVDYIDLLLVHWPTGKYTEYWSVFEELYDEGLVKNIGVSNFTMRMLDELLPLCRVKPVINQVELHPLFTQKPLLKYCDSKEISLTAWSGFMVGELLKNTELLKLAEKYGKTAAQIILRWNYQNGVINIPKSTNPERIKENFRIFDFKIEFDDLKHIDSLNQNLRKGPNPENFDF